MTHTNQEPQRPKSRDAVYDVIDGERDHQDEKYPTPEHSIDAYMAHILRHAIKAQNTRDPANGLRKIAALAVRGMEVFGARPREWHVPASAGITGEMHLRDPGDKLR